MKYYDTLATDFGTIYVAVDEIGVSKIAVTAEDWQQYALRHQCLPDAEQCSAVIQELSEYLSSKRRQFSVPISIGGTHFCQKVWHELSLIPYGQVRTYAEIAAAVGSLKAYRAVGMANYQNPLPIIIPCHRVVGKDGKMTGYKGGISIKQYLLRLEGAI